MSGSTTMYTTVVDVGKAISDFVDSASERHRENVRNKQIVNEKKAELKATRESISRVRAEKIRKASENSEKNASDAIGNLAKKGEDLHNTIGSLNLDLQEVAKDIEKTRLDAVAAVGEEQRRLTDKINRLMEEQQKMSEELDKMNAELGEVEGRLREQMGILDDQVRTNAEYFSQSVCGTADAILDEIIRNIAFDPYCDYSLTVAEISLKNLMSEAVDLTNYDTVMDKLGEIRKFVSEGIETAKNGLTSSLIIDRVVHNLEETFSDSTECFDFEVTGNKSGLVEVVMEFDRCTSIFKIQPNGSGGVTTAIINDVEDGGDQDVHNRICRTMCKKIMQATELQEIPGEDFTETDPQFDEWDEYERTPDDRVRESTEKLNKRLQRI